MIEEYEDDAHICLKCRTTIIGLDNYVTHRRNNCSKKLNLNLPADASFNLKADDFFSSLELQSSSKKPAVPSTSGKTFSGILTRSKTSAVIHAKSADQAKPSEDTQRGKSTISHSIESKNIEEPPINIQKVVHEAQTAKSPVTARQAWLEAKTLTTEVQRNTSEAKTPTTEIQRNTSGAKTLITEIQRNTSEVKTLTTEIQRNTSATKTPATDTQRNSEANSPTSTSGKNAWIGGHQLKVLGHGDNQSRLIKAVDNLSRHTYLKKENDNLDIGMYDDSDEDSVDYEYEDDEFDEDEDDDIPPPRTGGKWKNDDLKIPPRSFTGGKWKPSSPIGDWNEASGDKAKKFFSSSPQNISKESLESNESISSNGGKWSLLKSDAPPSNHTKGKWKPKVDQFPPAGYSKGKWKPSLIKEKVDEQIPPPDYTKGKWKPALVKEKVEDQIPPADHTKGKWKPSTKEKAEEQFSPSEHTKRKWKAIGFKDKEKADEQFPPPGHTKGKWKPSTSKNPEDQLSATKGKGRFPNNNAQFPPSGHTKGKWKPANLKEQCPPPGHTKGKWKPEKKIKSEDKKDVPPFIKSNHSVQYWCGPCNRRLASKIVYHRHLKSELHFKRTLRERELDDSSNLDVNPTIDMKIVEAESWVETRPSEIKTNEFWSETNDLRKSTEETEFWPVNKTAHEELVDEINISSDKKSVEHWSPDKIVIDEANAELSPQLLEDVNRRIRKKKFIICSVCKSRVTSQMMGKHLISHYHCRKANLSSPEAQKLILDNIYSIILQSPYQCMMCRFYCNTHEHFLEHWKTIFHEESVGKRAGYLWCSFCKFSCTENTSMYVHLSSHEHLEVISVINKSVPIVINKINPISCETCSKSFILNIQLRKHCEEENHKCSGTASDEYQRKIFCNLCESVFKSSITLQRHIKRDHNMKIFFCSACGVNFENAADAAKHRSGEEHRAKTQKAVPKSCEYCEIVLSSFLAYKNHLKEAHPERTHNCPHCGLSFTLPQEVTVHIRSKSCVFTQEEKSGNTCDRCPYSTESVSDLIYHKALHGNPVVKEGTSKELSCYECPLCRKSFTKHSLKFHIRNHMDEKAYECSFCGVKFARKNNWKMHVKKHAVGKIKSVSKVVQEQVFQCGVCEATFKQKSTLNNHMIIHSGKKFKCPTPDCFHTARSAAELKTHEKVHSDEKTYKCSTCDYVGKTKPLLKRHEVSHENVKKYKCPKCSFTARFAFHLKRHELVHTGAKPYACPHCDYRCNTIENLRKHVLSTNKHPGKRLYECKFCDEHQFHTNFAKDFRLHLITAHSSVFGSGSEATSYIAGIYDNKPAGMAGIIRGKDANSGMMPLELPGDSNMDSNVLIAAQATSSYSNINKGEDLFGDEVTCVDKDAWSIVASFDVEETAALVSFDAEEEAFFEEDFIDP